MKRTIFRKTILVLLCLIYVINYVTIISHASNNATVEICIVFDNSASTYKNETWCQSQHAMEVFASMINYENGHKLRIYPLCDVAIGDYTTSDTEKVLRINGIEDVSLITNLQTIRPAGTPFSPVQVACEYLKSVSSAKDKRLIILTDGEFDGIPNGSKGLSDKLTSMIYNTDIKIHYIGYGTASPLNSNKQKGLYSSQATNTTELIDKLMDTYCSIFKQTLTTISDSDGFQMSTDSDKLIVVATGAEASVGSLHHEDGTSNIPNAKFSRFVRAKDYKRPSEFPKASVDTTSETHVAIFDDCVQGQYSIDYKNTKMFQIFCDSTVDIAPISTKDVNHPWIYNLRYIWLVIFLAMLSICSMWLIIIQSHNKTKTHQQHAKENTVLINERIDLKKYKQKLQMAKKQFKNKKVDDIPLDCRPKMPDFNFEKDSYVVISYSRQDYVEVYLLLAQLYNEGYRFWYDNGMKGTKKWIEEYRDKFKNPNCLGTITFFSNNYISDSTKEELEIIYSTNGYEKQNIMISLIPLNEIVPDDVLKKAILNNRITIPNANDISSILTNIVNAEKKKTIHRYSSESDIPFLVDKIGAAFNIRGKTCENKPASSTFSNNQNSPLQITSTKDTSFRFQLKRGSHLVGKDKRKCNIPIDDSMVSNIHAIIDVSDKEVTIKDLNTTNGTLVNGKRIEPDTEFRIYANDTLQFGDSKFIVTPYEDSAERQD